ncbi:MAG: hypothetical protein R2822_10285 [Spirosomataceae bacterium]
MNFPSFISTLYLQKNSFFGIWQGYFFPKNQSYLGTIDGSSKLVEWINGKAKFLETGDEPLPPIR